MRGSGRVLVGIPTHGRSVDGGLIGATHRWGDVPATITWSSSSLLAANFNRLLCQGKNEGFRWLLLWHGDIVPDGDDWLERMIQAAEDTQADALSAVVPIKGPLGVSSTAALIGGAVPSIRRITQAELQRLPDRFGAADVAFLWPGVMVNALLLNTGLMLLRLPAIDPAAGLHFEIRDRIRRKADGGYEFHVLSEDWGWSVRATRAALSLVATKVPAVSHVGGAEFQSRAVWGVAADQPFECLEV